MPDTVMPTPSLDEARLSAFEGRLVEMLNSAALAPMLGIGHRTGLLRTMADLPAATSAEIAAAAGLQERYVREWLSALAVARIVDHDPVRRTFALPAEHAALLTDGSGLPNMAVAAQMITTGMEALPQVTACFRHGGGTSYEHYPCFHEAMAEESAQSVGAALFDAILPLIPGIEERLERGIEVLDAGCGAGRALLAMAQRYPGSRFTGYDLCADALAMGRAEADRQGLGNIRFVARDLTGWSEPARYDLIMTFDAVHDQKDPAGLLSGIARSLRPGGVYLMQDIGGSSLLERNMDHPLGTMLYAISTLHCMPVSLGQGGAGLGTMWGVEMAEQMQREAGFTRILMNRLAHDPVNAYFVASIA